VRLVEPRGTVVEMHPPGDPGYYVRGHLSTEEATAAVVRRLAEDDGGCPALGPCEHLWGRWAAAGPEDGPGEDAPVWHVRDDRRPGYARVTLVWEADAWRRREESRAVEARVRSDAARRWPGCEVRHVSAWPWAERRHVSAEIIMPGHAVRLRWRPWSAVGSVVEALDWRLPRVALREAAARLGLVPA
jgi:hypothetical protein